MSGMRTVVALLVAVAMAVSMSSAALAQDATDPPELLPVSPLIISAYSLAGKQPRYIELYNNSSQLVKATDWSVSLVWALGKDSPVGSAAPELASIALYPSIDDSVPYIPPGGYIVIGFNGAVSNALGQITLDGLPDFAYVSELRLEYPARYRPYVRLLTETQAVAGSTMRLNVGTTGYTTTYGSVNADQIYQDKNYYYAPSGGFPLAPLEIVANPKSCSSLDGDSSCLEYVKFYNDTPDAVDFAGTRLRAGSSATELSGVVASGEYVLFTVSLPNAGGYISLEDTYGIHTYENTILEYPDASAASKKGKSWALIDGIWQWAIPSPGGVNTPIVLTQKVTNEEEKSGSKPCRTDQYRNPETNRCKLIASSSLSAKPCAANQYRNPETNRCKAITSLSSTTQKPCAANQYRNPETNRCKSIATAASQLKPCAANQERNPETNRCRNTLASVVPTADFAVESDEGGDSQPLGWIAFVGVGVLALGYAGWEWRYEIVAMFRKLKRLVIKA